MSVKAADNNSYGAVRDFLASKTKVVELIGERGERVAICPEYQGRVMTSTVGDLEGRSLGWVNKSFIERGTKDPHFNNYGGEDRLWIGPEGGQFSLWFAPGAEQTLANWITPAGLNDGAFTLASGKDQPFERLTRKISLQNAAGTKFELEIQRDIHLQKAHHFGKLFGEAAEAALGQARVRMVGFQSVNTIINRGAAMTRDKGLLSIWSLGQFPASPRTFIILPYGGGDSTAAGPVVNTDYFGRIPPDRLRISPQAVWFMGDGKYRSKIGIPQGRAKQVAASIDLAQGVLTLVHFSMPADPTQYSYVNNQWGKQPEPFRGDVVNSYNDGPPEPGKPAMGGFYEIESLSPAMQLPNGKSFTPHTHTTFHIEGPPAAIAKIANEALGVDVKVDELASEKSKR